MNNDNPSIADAPTTPDSRGSAPVPGSALSPLDDKLEGIRYCIAKGFDEDALEHIFDLVRALRLRGGHRPDDLTPEGEASIRMLSPNNAIDQSHEK